MDFAREVYDALKSYAPKRLITSRFSDENGDHCAVGTLMPQYGITQCGTQANFKLLTLLRARSFTDRVTSDMIATVNNEFEGTPEERYEYMLAWCEKKLGLTKMEPIPQEEKERVTA